MSNFHIDLGGLDGESIAVDGFEIAPMAWQVASRSRWRNGSISVSRRLAKPPPIRSWRCSKATTNRPALCFAPEMHRSPASPALAGMASPALTLDLERSSCKPPAPLEPRKADRTHTLNLTGNMASYVWSLNNVAWTKETPPLPIAKGERVELVFVNQTPMPHPMHLHGHEFQVVEINDQRFSGAVRDTVLVPPGHKVVVAFDANNPGLWALHCHLLYHLGRGDVHDLALRPSATS